MDPCVIITINNINITSPATNIDVIIAAVKFIPISLSLLIYVNKVTPVSTLFSPHNNNHNIIIINNNNNNARNKSSIPHPWWPA